MPTNRAGVILENGISVHYSLSLDGASGEFRPDQEADFRTLFVSSTADVPTVTLREVSGDWQEQIQLSMPNRPYPSFQTFFPFRVVFKNVHEA